MVFVIKFEFRMANDRRYDVMIKFFKCSFRFVSNRVKVERRFFDLRLNFCWIEICESLIRNQFVNWRLVSFFQVRNAELQIFSRHFKFFEDFWNIIQKFIWDECFVFKVDKFDYLVEITSGIINWIIIQLQYRYTLFNTQVNLQLLDQKKRLIIIFKNKSDKLKSLIPGKWYKEVKSNDFEK